MSVVDDHISVVSAQARAERLWQTGDTTVTATHPSLGTPRADTPTSPRSHAAPEPESVFTRAGNGDQLWQARIGLVVSSGLSGDVDRDTRRDVARAQSKASFEALLRQCRDELRPVLERSAEMLHEWGLEARVTETLRDEPARVPRSFDLALSIDRFGDRGPGRLTITATEGSDFVRVKLMVGPTTRGSEATEHVGTTTERDLCDALVGGLVATLVEQIFNE
jgi:hypothetical protein